MIDSTDQRIITMLQDNARASNAGIARELGMAPSAIFERIRKLEHRGIITGYEARLAPRAVGLGLLAYVFVRSDEGAADNITGQHLTECPEVLEVHHVAGEDCYLVKVRAADTDDLARILRERFGATPGVRSTRSTIVLSTLKESARLPLGQLAGTAGESTDAA